MTLIINPGSQIGTAAHGFSKSMTFRAVSDE